MLYIVFSVSTYLGLVLLALIITYIMYSNYINRAYINKNNGLNIMPLKSLCFHGIIPGACAMCNAASQAAAVKRASLLKPLIIPKQAAFANAMANCEHR
jgi:hypothetical protein